MKLSIYVDGKVKDTQVAVTCGAMTPEVERLIAAIQVFDRQISATKDGVSHILDVGQIVYVEAVDRKTFLYTQQDFYESKLKLYELEAQLWESGFIRASKSCLIQLKYVRSLKAELNRKIRVTLENGEQLIVSRQYADELKRKLGVQ